jgi:outer membrane receptor for ferrienterochelin and colicins
VSFTDAVTGIKQIQLLGLSSPYILFTQENIPAIKGANQLLGFGFIPGTWVESIQIAKGAGSVINGYESITGQINFELKKPHHKDKFFFNLYGAENGRWEFNADYNQKLNEHLGVDLMLHTNLLQTKNDHNIDGFLDDPMGKQINFLNRWNFDNPHKNYHTSLIWRYIKDERQAGQVDFNPKNISFQPNIGEVNPMWKNGIFTISWVKFTLICLIKVWVFKSIFPITNKTPIMVYKRMK